MRVHRHPSFPLKADEQLGAIKRTFPVADEIGPGDVVYLNGDERLKLALSNTPVAGIVLFVASSDFADLYRKDMAEVCVYGPVEGWDGLEDGDSVFLSETTPGGMDTQGKPAITIVGVAKGNSIIFVAPKLSSENAI